MTSVKRLPSTSRLAQPLPLETVRDLLGLARAMYAAQKKRGNHATARRLQHAGEKLRRALALAVRHGAAVALADAWRLANEAIGELAREQAIAQEDLGRVIDEISARVNARRFGPNDREAGRDKRIKRG